MPIQPRWPMARENSRLNELFENPIRCWYSLMNSRTSPRIASASGGSSTGSKRNIGVAIVVSLPVRIEAGEGVRDAADVGDQFLHQARRHGGRKMQVDGI